MCGEWRGGHVMFMCECVGGGVEGWACDAYVHMAGLGMRPA